MLKPYYIDIIERINEEPKWYDKNGVPRYRPFHPDLAPNIYARQVVLMEIQCQACGKKFLVELDWSPDMEEEDLKTQIKEGWIHYGDPPRHNCVGDTMNSISLKILEFWEKKEKLVSIKDLWVRRREYEINLEGDE